MAASSQEELIIMPTDRQSASSTSPSSSSSSSPPSLSTNGKSILDSSKGTPNPHPARHWVHLLGGGLGGTVGALVTSPLEVIKTRIQSSKFGQDVKPFSFRSLTSFRTSSTGIIFRKLVKDEGVASLWKGIGPTLVGVIPARAIYFYTYSSMKPVTSRLSGLDTSNSFVHFASSCTAGFACATLTNPLWLIKTRLQLASNGVQFVPAAPGLWGTFNHVLRYNSVWSQIKAIYDTGGIAGFYRGLTASYAGISETALNLVLYERLKMAIARTDFIQSNPDLQAPSSFFAGATSKFLACITCYPHEVVRTRMREENSQLKYTGFFQALRRIWIEEGPRRLYAGLPTHLLRVVPNSAIIFLIYELTVKAFP